MNQNKKPLKRQEEFKRLRGVTMKTSDQKRDRKGREDQEGSASELLRHPDPSLRGWHRWPFVDRVTEPRPFSS